MTTNDTDPNLINSDQNPENLEVSSDTDLSTDLSTSQETDVINQDLNLFELLKLAFHKPKTAWTILKSVLTDTDTELILDLPPSLNSLSKEGAIPTARGSKIRFQLGERTKFRLAFQLLALLIGIWGSLLLVNAPTRSESQTLMNGLPFIIIAIFLWFIADLIFYWKDLQTWWRTKPYAEKIYFLLRLIPFAIIFLGVMLLIRSFNESAESLILTVQNAVLWIGMGSLFWFALSIGWHLARRKEQVTDFQPSSRLAGFKINPLRIFILCLAIAFTILSWGGTTGNSFANPVFGIPVFYFWMLSIISWVLVFFPDDWHFKVWLNENISRIKHLNRSQIPVLLLILGAVFLAAYFRLNMLNEIPPEMTSDHVEKLLDAQRVLNGQHSIFFANNGGREPFQMYALALFSQLPGMGINHLTLKLLAVLESLITIPILVWMGRELINDERRHFGLLVGILIAYLFAVSYWHVSVTRLALRIILTPIVSATLLIYLSRAIRYNHRTDYMKAGLILGFGLYMYQAVRMLPVVILVAVAIGIFFFSKNMRDRFRYLWHLTVLVIIAFVVFLPMFHYSVENPEHFWMRTTGRLLGDDVVYDIRPDGTIVERNATLEERFEAFQQNIPTLMNNIRNVLLMFNWKGDVAWINGYPNYPAMDAFSGTLFLLGTMACLALMIRKRDPIYLLLLPMIFIMLLPSALAIAYPVENPSLTRTSGAMPFVYLVSALALALLIDQITAIYIRKQGKIAAALLATILILGAYLINSNVYFKDFRNSYIASSLPYTEPGSVLTGFALTGGAYGNAFMIATPHWWDHRAVGLAAGLTDWPNGIPDPDGDFVGLEAVDQLPQWIWDGSQRKDKYRFDPTKDIMIFYSIQDMVSEERLLELFPDGYITEFKSNYPRGGFKYFRVPHRDGDWLEDFYLKNVR